jgi:hypothetical protein
VWPGTKEHETGVGPTDTVSYHYGHDDEIEAFVSEARRLFRPSGPLIVSVPILLGPVVSLKELNRMILFWK